MSAYSDWVAQIQAGMVALGYSAYGSTDWAVTTMPTNVNSGHAGEPAVRLSVPAFNSAYYAGLIPNAGYASPNGSFVYVLASSMTGNSDVVTSSPHTMTAAEQAANAGFSALDAVGDATGISSLLSGLSELTKQIVIGVAVATGVALILKRK